jgi:RNA polymerase sigma-70 factor (ECF subfamily)
MRFKVEETVAAQPETSRDRQAREASAGAVRDQRLRVSALVQRVAAGDRTAFAELYDEMAPSVFGVASRLVRNRELAEEVTQDVFTWVWREARSFDPTRGSEVALIRTVTRRRAVDAIRREEAARRRTAGDQVPLDRQVDPYGSFEDQEQLSQLMATLTELEREAVRLYYWEGLTSHELATRLGTKVSTAKTRKRDGIMRMRMRLAADNA